MKKFPETGFLRLPHIIGDPKAKLPIPPIIPVNKSCWWAGVKTGRLPKGVIKLEAARKGGVQSILST